MPKVKNSTNSKAFFGVAFRGPDAAERHNLMRRRLKILSGATGQRTEDVLYDAVVAYADRLGIHIDLKA